MEVIVIGLPRSDSKEGKGHGFLTSQWNSCQHHIVSRAYEIGDIVAVTGYYKGEIQLNTNFLKLSLFKFKMNIMLEYMWSAKSDMVLLILLWVPYQFTSSFFYSISLRVSDLLNINYRSFFVSAPQGGLLTIMAYSVMFSFPHLYLLIS